MYPIIFRTESDLGFVGVTDLMLLLLLKKKKSFAEQNFKLPMRLGNGFVLVSVSLTSGSAVSVPVRRSH